MRKGLTTACVLHMLQHFSVLVFLKKMTRDVTGHRSNALQLYRAPITDTERNGVQHACPRKEVVY